MTGKKSACRVDITCVLSSVSSSKPFSNRILLLFLAVGFCIILSEMKDPIQIGVMARISKAKEAPESVSN